MSEIPQRRKRWSLTREALDALLGRLGEDRESAGSRFEALRHKLVQYFSYDGRAYPDRWADETLDRVAKRLAEGTAVDEVEIFARGVARMVLREARLLESRERSVKEPTAADTSARERDARCLEDCIAALAPEARRLVEQYYLGSPESRVAARKMLAAKLGISMDALRSRALRIRRELENCVAACREKDQL